jgi:glycosyltransferase involved in cell wall biosynthesis
MIAAVIPARNEAATIGKVLRAATNAGAGLLIPVVNGCTDSTPEEIKKAGLASVKPVFFDSPLGVDVPRAVGAALALQFGAKVILFVDADMGGEIQEVLLKLVKAVTGKNIHLALTDCYPPEEPCKPSPLAGRVLKMRRRLNRIIGLEKEIGAASPSHGPHAVSRRFFEEVPLRELAVPPVALALAAKKGLSVALGAQIPHPLLGSPVRDSLHAHLVAETIIGDCLEAIQTYRGEPRDRTLSGVPFTGYHNFRRFDLLEKFLAGENPEGAPFLLT